MPFVIFNTKNDKYVTWNKNKANWVDSTSNARQFENAHQARQFVQSQLTFYCKSQGIDFSGLQVQNMKTCGKSTKQQAKTGGKPLIGDNTLCIMDSYKNLFLALAGNQIQWIADPTQARLCKNNSVAQQFIQSEKNKIMETGVDLSHLVLMKVKSRKVVGWIMAERPMPILPAKPPVMPVASAPKSSVPAAPTENKKSENKPDFQTSLAGILQQIEHWDACLSQLPQALEPFRMLYGATAQAITFCDKEVKNADLEICDILHKIEFVKANAAQGYQFYKELHECRLRRRKLKDMRDLLTRIQSMGIVDSVHQFSVLYDDYCDHIENRTYHPRIREDLFTDQSK